MSVNEKMTAIADAIRDKTGETEKLTLDDMPKAIAEIAGYNEGYEQGKQAEYDAFWDAYQENGNRTSYVEAFCRRGWNADTYNPKYPIIGVSYGFQSLFSNSRVVDTKVDLILRETGSMKAAFNNCSDLVRIPSLILEVAVTDAANAFTNCVKLEEINISCVGDGCFATDLNVKQCSKLTSNSVDNIINALKDLTGATSQTLTFHATVGGNLTDEQESAISAKNWTLVY